MSVKANQLKYTKLKTAAFNVRLRQEKCRVIAEMLDRNTLIVLSRRNLLGIETGVKMLVKGIYEIVGEDGSSRW